MTRNQVVDRIVSDVQGAIKTDETRFTRDFVQSHIDSARAIAIQQAWVRVRRINPQWLQEFPLYYDADIQGDAKCVTTYNVPAWIGLDGKTDGMTFIGNSENNNFRVINGRAELANYLNIPLQSPYEGRFVAVVREAGFIELHYKNRIKFTDTNQGKILMLYDDPAMCPTYNILQDNYPISTEIMPLMEDLLIKKFFQMAGQPIDKISNSSDYKQAPITPARNA